MIRRVVAVSAIAALAVAAVTGVQLRGMTATALQSCIEQPPFAGSAWACRAALYSAHPTPAEVEHINRRAGAVWLLSLPEDEARRLLQHFVAAGVDVNAVDQESDGRGWTSLHLAAFDGDTKAVRLLLEAGAKPDVTDRQGMTPRDIAQQRLAQQPTSAGLAEMQGLLGSR